MKALIDYIILNINNTNILSNIYSKSIKIIIILLLNIITINNSNSQNIKYNISDTNNYDSVLVLNDVDTNYNYPTHTVISINILDKKSLIITEHTILHQIKVWNLLDGSLVYIIEFGKSEYFDKILISHDEEKLIVSIGYNKYIYCFNIVNKKLLWKVKGIPFYNGLGISENDSLIYAVGPSYITSINSNSGKIVRKDLKFLSDCYLPQLRSLNVIFSPSGRYALYWEKAYVKTINLHIGSRLNVWDLSVDNRIATKFIKGKGVWSASFLPNEKEIITGSHDGSLRLWSLDKNKILNSWKIHKNVGSFNNCVVQTVFPKKTDTFLGTEGVINGKSLFVIWKYPIMKAERLWLTKYDSCSAAFSDDSKYFVISYLDYMYLFETNTWKLIWKVHNN